jgi:polyisoprenoid-binding protein YceI
MLSQPRLTSCQTYEQNRTGENTGELTGDLTMHGVRKEVVLKVDLLGKGAGQQGKTVSDWEATNRVGKPQPI